MGHVRWNCAKKRALTVGLERSELSAEELEFFKAMKDWVIEVEDKKDLTPAEENFFKVLGYVKNIGEDKA